ncbi:hypothetical protein V6N12_022886 [Hibiscus sabdariffa]|uniref:Uncharacterized protein n=1 Tax=Hibiscus sabdariffa TaxID=183260 RepID=A0ABR2FW19_9ROSI
MAGDSPRKSLNGGEGEGEGNDKEPSSSTSTQVPTGSNSCSTGASLIGGQASSSNLDSAAANENENQPPCSSLPALHPTEGLIQGEPSQQGRVPFSFLDSIIVNGEIVFLDPDTAAYFADINRPNPAPAPADATNEVLAMPEMAMVPGVGSNGIHGNTQAIDATNGQPMIVERNGSTESTDGNDEEEDSLARNIVIGDQQQASGDGTGHEYNLPPRQAESMDGNDERGTSSARNIANGDQQQASGDGTGRRYNLRPRQANGRVRNPE